ncbi:MAG: hypothetical protein AB2L14_08935 [Candidatus Xenobiia bacterium LiM19]
MASSSALFRRHSILSRSTLNTENTATPGAQHFSLFQIAHAAQAGEYAAARFREYQGACQACTGLMSDLLEGAEFCQKKSREQKSLWQSSL